MTIRKSATQRRSVNLGDVLLPKVQTFPDRLGNPHAVAHPNVLPLLTGGEELQFGTRYQLRWVEQ